MAGPNLEQILGLPRLTKLIKEQTSGLPQEKTFKNKLPGFLNSVEEITGNAFQATLTKGQRKTTKRTVYNAPPHTSNLETIGIKNWIMTSSAESITIDPITMQNLRQYDSFEFQERGAEEVGRQIGLFKQKFMNNRLVALTNSLVRGNIYWDSSFNMLPTSSGADTTLTLSQGISANHQNQLNGIIDLPWSNPLANIPKQILDIKKNAAYETGYEPSVAIYGASIPSYLAQNQYTIQYAARSEDFRNAYLDYTIPDGYLGVDKWVPGWNFFFEDSSGTNQQLVPDDAFIFFPEPDKSWFRMYEGSVFLPKTLNIQIGDLDAAFNNLEKVFGMYAYAQLQNRPVSVELIMGDTYLPAIVNPDVIWQADVNF